MSVIKYKKVKVVILLNKDKEGKKIPKEIIDKVFLPYPREFDYKEVIDKNKEEMMKVGPGESKLGYVGTK